MKSMKEMDDLAQKCLDACISQGWSRKWQEVGAYLGLECAEYVEEIRRGDKQNISHEAADILFVLLSSLAREGVSMWDVLARLVFLIDINTISYPRRRGEGIMRIKIDDEVVKENTHFRMERMDDDHIWFTLGDMAFDLYAIENKLTWTPQERSWEKLQKNVEDISVVANDGAE